MKQIASILPLFLLAMHASAVSIQFDFSTNQFYSVGTESPAHFLSLLPMSHDKWNGVGHTADPTVDGATGFGTPRETEPTGNNSLSFVYADGSAAPGIRTDFGAFFQVGLTGPGNPAGQMNWAANESFIRKFSTPQTAAIHNTALGRDIFALEFAESSGGAVAFRVRGLPADTYDVLPLVFVDSGAAASRTYNVRIGVNMNFLSDDTPDVVGSVSGVTSWTLNKDYARQQVTISGTNDWITVFVTGIGVNPAFNGLQIVAIPEPATVALLLLGPAVWLARRARRSA